VNSFAMTPEEAFARRQRNWRVTLATVIVVLVSLTVWVIEQLTQPH
jgi:hypothetical protein